MSMGIFENEKISMRQLEILIVANNLALGLILLPELFFNGFVFNMLLLLFFLFAIVILDFKLIEWREKNFLGGYVLKFIYGLLLIKIILSASFELSLFMEIAKKFILPETNKFIVGLILFLAGNYLALKGYETRARLCEILVWLLILPLIIFFVVNLFSIKKIVYEDDFLFFDWKKNFDGIFIFSQLDYLFLLDFCDGREKKVDKRKILRAVFFVWFVIFVLIYVMRLKINFDMRLGILKFMSLTDLPGGFIQGQDFFVISFVIVSFFILLAGKLFFIKKLFRNLSGKNGDLILGLVFGFNLISQKNLWLMICLFGSLIYFLFLSLFVMKNIFRSGDLK